MEDDVDLRNDKNFGREVESTAIGTSRSEPIKLLGQLVFLHRKNCERCELSLKRAFGVR